MQELTIIQIPLSIVKQIAENNILMPGVGFRFQIEPHLELIDEIYRFRYDYIKQTAMNELMNSGGVIQTDLLTSKGTSYFSLEECIVTLTKLDDGTFAVVYHLIIENICDCGECTLPERY